ncbi:MAG TPA: signal peptide peptidase SppA [Polyangia bacterium]|nr:signal peptide peptidase SppA [Polyangia bacterium]
MCFFSGSRAFAQASDPDLRPTRGPFIPEATRAGFGDATDTELNPAALALMPAADAELVGSAAGQGATIPRRGAGLYLAAPLWSSGVGFALTRVIGTGEAPIDDHTTLRLAVGLRLGRYGAVGASWAHTWEGAFAGSDTFDLGLSVLAGRHLAAAFTIEDVNQPLPSSRATGLPRLWTGELAYRPLGTRRLQIALGAAHAGGDAWSRVVPWARVVVGVTGGFGLYAQAERVPAYGDGAFSGSAYTNAGLGLTIDLDHLGLILATQGYFAGSGSSTIGPAPSEVPVPPVHTVGFAGRLRVDGARSPGAVAPSYVARIRLEGIHDDRDFFRLVRRLRALALDRAAVAVLFKMEGVDLGYGRVEELRELIGALRARGKRTAAYVTFPSTRDYYLAAACDAVLIHPAGSLALTGISQSVMFYKGAMDRLGVQLELVRVGAYKGAMEPFIMTEQSPAVRANRNQLLDDVYGRVTETIAVDRTRAGHAMSGAVVRTLVDRGVFVPGAAVLAGLVDGIAAEGDLEGAMAALLRRPVPLRDADASPERPIAWPGRRVAVLFVDGTMVDGPSAELPFGMGGFAGSDTLSAALERCRRDPSVGAVVLRVNSPGGSAFASDVLAREIKQVRAAGKPIVVSMGDMAASGGYYIAAPADVIYAEPSTLSGSIGVFGYKVDAQKLIGSLGLNVETYRRGAHADLLSSYRPWTEAERALAEDEIHHLYGLFLQTVADGRKRQGLTVARVNAIGEGHVWTGALAMPLGLVDRMGGLSTAIDEAARLGGVPLANDEMPDLLLLPPEEKGLLHQVARATSAIAEAADEEPAPPAPGPARLLNGDLKAAARLLAPFLLQPGDSGYQARLPYELELR